jgi:membrane protease YdiL (CAAX protease family)
MFSLGIGLIDAFIVFVLIVVILVGMGRTPLGELGFQMKDFRISLKATAVFVSGFMILYIAFGTIAAKHHLFDYTFHFPLSTANILQWFAFEWFVSGFEEIFFRCFVIMLLYKLWKRLFPRQKQLTIAVVAASTLLFAMRHVGDTFFPFKIYYFVPLHLLVVTVLGVYLGILFVKTRNFLAVYTAHGLVNGCIYAFLLVLNVVMR